MSSSLFFSAPRAMGDNIVCNGLYRFLAKNYSICYLPIKKSMVVNMCSMLEDLENIEFIVFPDSVARRSTHVAARIYEALGTRVLKFGWDGKDFPSVNSKTWDRNMYDQLELNFDLRWDNYFVPRNYSREEQLFRLLGGDQGPFAFVHEDLSRGFEVKPKFIDPSLRVIKANPNLKQFSIFDYRKLLENASEIHCIEGSFSALVESEMYNVDLFAHRYARPEVIRNSWHAYAYKLNWKILV
jgi:hypothetical protein